MTNDDLILSGRMCPYCGRMTELIDSAVIYGGRSYGMIYMCRTCETYVGCHDGTTRAKGRLANAELREWKKMAHSAFDPIWQKGHMKRKEAYAWLSERMGIPFERTHIGMFDVAECQRVVSICVETKLLNL